MPSVADPAVKVVSDGDSVAAPPDGGLLGGPDINMLARGETSGYALLKKPNGSLFIAARASQNGDVPNDPIVDPPEDDTVQLFQNIAQLKWIPIDPEQAAACHVATGNAAIEVRIGYTVTHSDNSTAHLGHFATARVGTQNNPAIGEILFFGDGCDTPDVSQREWWEVWLRARNGYDPDLGYVESVTGEATRYKDDNGTITTVEGPISITASTPQTDLRFGIDLFDETEDFARLSRLQFSNSVRLGVHAHRPLGGTETRAAAATAFFWGTTVRAKLIDNTPTMCPPGVNTF